MISKEELKLIFQKRYADINFTEQVLRPVFGDRFRDVDTEDMLESNPDIVDTANEHGIVNWQRIGEIKTLPGKIDIFDITVKSKVQMHRNRISIQSTIHKVMRTVSSAFMIFHYETGANWDWRFTFYRKQGAENSDPKRYTFLLGPDQACRTAAENFIELANHHGALKVDDVQKAFDVEALSKEFFTKYKTHYEKFCQFVYDNKHNPEFFGEEFTQWEDKTIRDYVKKLLGRIVFLHFLQKKGWMGVPEGGTWGDGDRQYMRTLFKNSKAEEKDNYLDKVLEPLYLEMDKILCGGLFERDAMDAPDSRFPAEYFDSLFEFLYEYNFTIDENDPNDAEVGVDPEMLGRIFENLLEDNKDKGAFYTPKEIVQYMCRESLIAYLTTASIESGNPNPREKVEEAIRRLVINPEEIVPKMTDKHKEDFGNALRNVKICDPAIGSGAFPMGLLNELVRCRVAIDAWAKNESGNILVDDYAALKCEIVCNNIYGVDIERGAIDIARLRFWLSIVVDEKEPHALPNLDYKFMEGNSLIPTFDGQYINLDTNQQTHANVGKMRNEKIKLRKLKQEHFSATGSRKHELAIEIKDSILRLISLQLGNELREWYDAHHPVEQLSLFGESEPKQLSFADIIPTLPPEKQRICDLGAELRKQLRDENIPLEQRAQLDIRFFDWRMMFTEVFDNTKPGFDIVIGNPPYKILTKNNTDEDIHKHYISDFKSIKNCNSKNLFTLFIELGVEILLKNNGIMSYIIPEGLFKTRSYADCVKVMHSVGHTIQYVTFDDYVFENAVTGSLIFEYQKLLLEATPLHYQFDSNYNLCLYKNESNNILSKIENNTEKLKDVCELFKGMVVKDRTTVVFEERNDLPDVFLLGKSIAQWAIVNEFYTDYNNLTIIGGTKKLSKHNVAPRIVVRRTGDKLCCAYVESKALTESTLYSCWSKRENIDNLYIIGLLNSSLLDYYNKKRNITNQQGFPQILMTDLQELPIKIGSPNIHTSITTLVSRILSAKKANPLADTSAEELEIDHLVYHLYDLTYDEVLIIDPETPITREEYNNFNIEEQYHE